MIPVTSFYLRNQLCCFIALGLIFMQEKNYVIDLGEGLFLEKSVGVARFLIFPCYFFIYLFIYVFIYLIIYLSNYLLIYLFICLLIYLSIQFIYLFIYLLIETVWRIEFIYFYGINFSNFRAEIRSAFRTMILCVHRGYLKILDMSEIALLCYLFKNISYNFTRLTMVWLKHRYSKILNVLVMNIV